MYCGNCNELGMIVVCIDDMCRGIGECIHGDGMTLCPCRLSHDEDDFDYAHDYMYSPVKGEVPE